MPKAPRSSATNTRDVTQRVLQYCFGPWPIRPVFLGILFGAFNQYSVARIAEAQEVSLPAAAVAGLPSTILQSFALFLAAVVAQKFQQRMDPAGVRRGVYLLGILITDVIFSAIRLVLVPRDPQVAGIVALRDFVALLIVSALFGIAGERLARQVRQTQDALALVAVQREQLLVADESARQEVARFLHDTVQADLVVLAMQLRSQASTLTSAEGERIASVVDELDKVRLLDIRAASRRLNPDIESLGLSAALRELATGYAPAMTVTVDCPFALPGATPDHALAIYRICEQALLNAAVHGRATECAISIARQGSDVIAVDVRNDGRDLVPGHLPGAGSAIIEAWVSRFDGAWSLHDEAGQTILRASVTLEA